MINAGNSFDVLAGKFIVLTPIITALLALLALVAIALRSKDHGLISGVMGIVSLVYFSFFVIEFSSAGMLFMRYLSIGSYICAASGASLLLIFLLEVFQFELAERKKPTSIGPRPAAA